MEKTFEELIEIIEQMDDDGLQFVYSDDVLKLLKQVREATKAETLEILNNKNYMWDDMKFAIQKLPTDRILITEKEE